MVTITNEHVGGFLMAEGLLSIAFSSSKGIISQLGRITRIGIGYYIYDKTSFSETI